VIDRLLESALSPEGLRGHYRDAQRRAAELTGEVDDATQRLQAEMKDVQARVQRITAAISEMGHSRALLASLADLEKRQAELARELAGAGSRKRAVELPNLSDDQLERLALELTAKFKDEDPGVQIEALRGLIVEVRAERLRSGDIEGQVLFVLPFGQGKVKELSL
jgi:hypothetical protein